MMKYINSLFAVGMVVCFASCSHEDQNPDTAVALEARVGKISIDTKSSGSDISALNGKNITLYAVNAVVGEQGYGVDGVGREGKYTITNGVAEVVTGEEIWLLKERAKVCSAYPSSSIVINNGKPYISVDKSVMNHNRSILAATTRAGLDFTNPISDYMYGVSYNSEDQSFGSSQPFADNGKSGQPAKINEYGQRISIGFRQAFAKLALEIKKGDYSGSGELTEVSYMRKNYFEMNDNIKMNIVDGTFINVTPANEQGYKYMIDNSFALNDGNVVFTCYAFPISSSTDATITVRVDGKDMKITIPSDMVWEQGKVYVYGVSVNNTGLALSQIKLVNWEDKELGNVTIN